MEYKLTYTFASLPHTNFFRENWISKVTYIILYSIQIASCFDFWLFYIHSLESRYIAKAIYTSQNWFLTKFRMVSSASCMWHILIILCVNVIFCISVYLYKWKWGLPCLEKKSTSQNNLQFGMK